ncbi:Protein unc-45 homolog B (Unc-45B) [Durusdinium trenchii]|uniref:Protein unc-45 homolog B n=1 Tax=Durusdinium trenchii TaxID=1381693 RepID=A0ABP0LBG4_9DINO
MEDKERGNELFKAGRFDAACEKYGEALAAVDKAGDQDAESKALKVTIFSNRAACFLRLKKEDAAMQDCNEALALDPTNVKLLFRRAQAAMAMKKVEDAFRDLRRLLELDPGNKAAQEMVKKLRSMAQDMNSTTTQALEVLDEAVATADDAQRTSKLRSMLGSIMEDEHLAVALAHKGACEKLWEMRRKSGLALKILSKMSEYDSCWQHVLAVVSLDELVAIAEQDHEEMDGGAACLNMLWRLVLQEDAAASKASDEDDQKEGRSYTAVLDADTAVGKLVRGMESDDDSMRRVAVEGVVRVCVGQKARCRRFFELGGLKALMSMIARDYTRDEPLQQVSVVLGQVLPALDDDVLIKGYALEFCKPLLLSAEAVDQIKGVAALDAIYYANKELGLALVQEEGLLEPLQRIARHGSERAQALSAEVFSHMANTEDGRGLLAGDITELLKLLATSDTGPVRSAAAVTLAKLNAIDFDAHSENGMLVLASVTSLLQPSASKEEHAKGVEAVCFVITDSQVKMMLMKGEGAKVLRELVGLAENNAKEAFAYGLSFIFENLTMSEDDKRREKLREMEVTMEQWEQFEKLTKSQTRKPGQEDSREQVAFRIQSFVQMDGIAALRSLVLGGGSDRVCEAIARTLANIATVQAVRPQMIAQGALKALFKLTNSGSDKSQKFAAHALGKIFITTNPAVLKDEQLMDAIEPLVRQVRHCDEDLVIFECCMALTNIATVNFEAKQKIVNSKGLQAFEYAQYSEELQVRRAATEAINNLIPTEESIEWFCRPEKMRLWLMFALAYDEDVGTAVAATGALANLAADERIAETLAKQEEPALPKIVTLASCGNIDIEHRAAVCLIQLIESWPDSGGKQALLDAKANKALQAICINFPDSAPAEIAAEALAALK